MMQPSQDITRLLEIMAALRTPVTGCQWDLAQTHASIAPYALEEAAEVVDAIERGDPIDLCDELGDLLLQVVFHARMAEEAGQFGFGDVVQAITAKMIRRHPHVFDANANLTPEEVKQQWGLIKAQEKQARAAARAAAGLPPERKQALDTVPTALPALTRAIKLQEKAAQVGFDWNDPRLVLAKIREEIDEVDEALNAGDQAAVAGEVGDLLFALTNLARHLKVDPDKALQGTNTKFTRRFHHIEQRLDEQGKSLAAANLDEMEVLWVEAKGMEREG